MIYVATNSDRASFAFAAEEYVMHDLRPQEPVLMLWSTRPTVMIGANQVVDLEIDRAKAEAAGVDIVRRSSGGGTIFTDPGTLLYTIILPYGEQTDPKDVVRDHLSKPVISAIASLGAAAVLEGRNDILIDGKKISGIAQFIKYGYLTSHGSLLFDADLDMLSGLLTVDNEKITSKALRSVRSRVANITESVEEKNIESFKSALLKSFKDPNRFASYELTAADLAAIDRIRKEKYEGPQWTYGRTPSYTFHNAGRFPGGRIEVFLDIKGSVIQECRITGDFLALHPIETIEAQLTGVRHDKKSIDKALAKASGNADLDALGSVTLSELAEVLSDISK
ncbi:MAG: lipoate--protein ligase [Clostridiales Family XIII bacterium]|jgi:lipoate-protein ligase A|nr:lipoate--protein ligase [Clostridiales Family XIII bacterium]